MQIATVSIAEVAILIPEKIDFKTNKKVTRYEKGHFMIKKGKIQKSLPYLP